jgi:DNA-binding FadR family transcriptional regulator
MREKLEDPEGYADLDVEFHLLLAEATRNKMMYYLIGSIRQTLRDAVLEGLRSRHTGRQIARVQELHEEILAQVERQDPDGAERAMLAHFDDAVAALVGEGVSTAAESG